VERQRAELLLDTTLFISSFGEDQARELYVVGITTGAVYKIAQTSPPPTCTYAISPTRMTFGPARRDWQCRGHRACGCGWTAARNVDWITITGGASGSGNGTVTYSVAPYSGKPRNRNGSATIAGQTFSVKQSR
jgi:hypothetical protein